MIPRSRRIPIPLLLAGALAACTSDGVGPRAEAPHPRVLQAFANAGVQDGPASLLEGLGEGGEPVMTVGVNASSFDAQSGAQGLPIAFHVHPNGGTRGNLRGKEVFNANATWPGVITLFCVINGTNYPTKGSVDSLRARNFGTPTGGHGSGHDFSDTGTGRPRGRYVPDGGNTDDAARFRTEYRANIASGDEMMAIFYTIKDPDSPCDGNSSVDYYRAVVRVPGLVQIPQDANLQLVPPTSNHPSGTFWFLEPTTLATTRRMGALFRRDYDTPMPLTAAALAQGGINDIGNNWGPSHWEHRVGTDIDVDDGAGNDPTRIRQVRRLGEQAGFAVCEGHGRRGEPPNHIHCKQRQYP
ncbi:MAG: hypothetical protein KY467_06030 [Gemmatimonadetes bacterium]|nr:hypothetical protein [Gemmatimonadota bacterium]